MSLKNTEDVLTNFIKSDIPQVLVIKGAWGTGKTYFLENYLKNHKDDKNLGFKKYSYVSLFGLKNISDLKLNLYQNSKHFKDIGREILFSEKIQNKNEWIKIGKKISDSADNVPIIKNYNIFRAIGTGSQALGFLEPKEYLIVIDDFERINKNIDIDEVLGLISELKEKRKCKIILVMNDEKIDNQALGDYKKIKEKVIDIEIEFKPTPVECSGIVFNDNSNQDDNDLMNFSIKLGITNIRIISKIHYFYYLIFPVFNEKNYDNDLKNQLKSSLVFLINSFYGNQNNDENNEIPGINFVLEENSLGNFNKYNEINPEPDFSKNWRNIFREYGWSHADEFDLELYNIIRRGYIIKNDFFEVGDKLNEMIISGNFKKQHTELWSIHYHCGFKDNEEEFINAFLNFYEEHSGWLDVNDLNSIVGIFRRLERNKETSQIIDFFIKQNSTDCKKLNLNYFRNHTSFNLDDEIKIKISNAFSIISSQYSTPSEVIQKIIDNGYSITGSDENILFSLSEDDIFNLINSLEGDIQRKYIEVLLLQKDSSIDWEKLSERAISAIKRFDTCKINHSRLESYGYLN